MSDAVIAAQQRRIDELTQQVATANAEAKKRRIEKKQLLADLDAERSKVTALTGERDGAARERDEWKTKATAAPGELQQKLAALEGQIAGRDHRDAFSKALAGFKVKGADGKEAPYGLNQGATVEDLWQALQYKAEGATPDAPAVAELLGKAHAAKPYLFAAATPPVETTAAAPGGAPGQPIRTPATPPGPGNGRTPESASAPPHSARSQIDSAFAKLGKDKPGRIA